MKLVRPNDPRPNLPDIPEPSPDGLNWSQFDVGRRAHALMTSGL
jgi:hypothetical protein